MRIVVVEDNELYRDELLQCLEQEGLRWWKSWSGKKLVRM